MILPKEARQLLMTLATEKGVYLEGNVLKVLETDGDEDFEKYLLEATHRDKEIRKKRLEVTKQVQKHNKELSEAHEENVKLMAELKESLEKSEGSKKEAEDNFNFLQKKTQFELMGKIVKVALATVIGVGVGTTTMYILSILTGRETALIGNTWSSMFGILLTNSFSIIGTIMGVKYASEGAKPIGS